ncbi:MAG: efflux RND transporter periplasmic adaptor subunit [Calditrichaeota bacterium]|nr:efflux RND transporter periplasmic adaptor subunit [Calditrichota bacterium]
MRRLVYIITLLLTVALVALLIYRINEFNNPPQFKTNEAIQLEKGVPVKLAKVERRTVRNELTFTGTVEGQIESRVYPKVEHEIKEFYVTLGKTVSAGDRLARLDVNAIGQQNLKYEQARLAYENAKKDLARMKSLLDGGAISQQQYDNAKLNHDLKQKDYSSIADAIYLTAPISGVVVERNGRIGNKASMQEAMFIIADIRGIKVRLRVSESLINQVKVGQTVEISGIAGQKVMGRVKEVSMAADPRDRTFEVIVEAPNPDFAFRPGMSAIVTVVTDIQKEALTVPKDALINESENPAVYLNKDGRAALNQIKLGNFDGTYYQVLAGLNESDEFVLLGAKNIQENMQKIIVVR